MTVTYGSLSLEGISPRLLSVRPEVARSYVSFPGADGEHVVDHGKRRKTIVYADANVFASMADLNMFMNNVMNVQDGTGRTFHFLGIDFTDCILDTPFFSRPRAVIHEGATKYFLDYTITFVQKRV